MGVGSVPDEREAYRLEVLRAMCALGAWYRDAAVQALGVPVASVWIHGSVLDPHEFADHSDVDVAFVIDDPSLPPGLVEDLSARLDGLLPDGVSGTVDALVLNREEPSGRMVPPIRIAGESRRSVRRITGGR